MEAEMHQCLTVKMIMVLQKYVVDWYHTYIIHLVTEDIEANISQH